MYSHTKNKRERELTMVNKCTKNFFFLLSEVKNTDKTSMSGNEMTEYCYCKTRPLKILTVRSRDPPEQDISLEEPHLYPHCWSVSHSAASTQRNRLRLCLLKSHSVHITLLVNVENLTYNWLILYSNMTTFEGDSWCNSSWGCVRWPCRVCVSPAEDSDQCTESYKRQQGAWYISRVMCCSSWSQQIKWVLDTL